MLAAALQLTLVIFVHELGHWFFAKLCGVRVVSFNLGFGPKLWSFQRNATTYALRWIPIGGYVLLADKTVSETASVPDNERLETKSWLARFSIMAGGALFNILLAWAVFYGVYLMLHQWKFFTAIYESLLILLQLLYLFVREIILTFSRGDFAGLSGPIGVLQMAAQSVQNGWGAFCLSTAFLSINLGIINLLPLPALDGGRLIFLLYELIFRRKPNPKVETFIHTFGLIFLLTLMFAISFLDLSRLNK